MLFEPKKRSCLHIFSIIFYGLNIVGVLLFNFCFRAKHIIYYKATFYRYCFQLLQCLLELMQYMHIGKKYFKNIYIITYLTQKH